MTCPEIKFHPHQWIALLAFALSACGGVHISASREYIHRLDIPPRSILTSEEEHDRHKTKYADWAGAGHIIHLHNGGKKTVTLTEVSLNWARADHIIDQHNGGKKTVTPAEVSPDRAGPAHKHPLKQSLELASGSTVSLPVKASPGKMPSCMVPSSLELKVQMDGKDKQKSLILGFAERMSSAQFRDMRQAGCNSNNQRPVP